MHWLIPTVSHALSCLVALFADSLAPAALLISLGLVASQSIHLWAIFYGLFAAWFLVGTCLTAMQRHIFRDSATVNESNNTRSATCRRAIRTGTSIVANGLVVAALVPLHQYYLKERMKEVPWFNIFRSKTGCFPVPSRSLTAEFQKSYTFVDALGNNLPFGIVVSYAIAAANTFASSLRRRPANGQGLRSSTLAGCFGALIMAFAAASGLPMCEDDPEGGTHEVTMHVDRSSALEERTSMTWSWEARYLQFVGATTLVATVGIAIIDRFAESKEPGSASQAKAIGAAKPEASSSKKENAVGGTEKTPGKPGPSDTSSSIIVRRDVVSLGVHFAVTSAVVIGMAIWSWR